MKIELKQMKDGRRRLRGRLGGVENGAIVLDAGTELWRFELSEIAVARLVPQTGSKP